MFGRNRQRIRTVEGKELLAEIAGINKDIAKTTAEFTKLLADITNDVARVTEQRDKAREELALLRAAVSKLHDDAHDDWQAVGYSPEGGVHLQYRTKLSDILKLVE